MQKFACMDTTAEYGCLKIWLAKHAGTLLMTIKLKMWPDMV